MYQLAHSVRLQSLGARVSNSGWCMLRNQREEKFRLYLMRKEQEAWLGAESYLCTQVQKPVHVIQIWSLVLGGRPGTFHPSKRCMMDP